MKTALVLGGAALALYVVWRLAANQGAAVSAAVVSTGAYTPSGPPVGSPFPAAPPPPVPPSAVLTSAPPGVPDIVAAFYNSGRITSYTPVFVNVSAAQRPVLAGQGYVIIGTSAYATPASNRQVPTGSSGTLVAGGGLPPAPSVYAQ